MQSNDRRSWKLTKSEYVLDDKFFKVRANSYITPEGHTIEPYYIVENEDWVNCFVIDDHLDVIMVEHYRPAADKYILELVSGGLENSDSSSEDGMRRELNEELGYVGGKVQQIGVSYPNPARQNNKVRSFIAFGGSCAQAQKLEKGESLHISKMPFSDFLETLAGANFIYQSMHLASIFFALSFIKESGDPELQEIRKQLKA